MTGEVRTWRLRSLYLPDGLLQEPTDARFRVPWGAALIAGTAQSGVQQYAPPVLQQKPQCFCTRSLSTGQLPGFFPVYEIGCDEGAVENELYDYWLLLL